MFEIVDESILFSACLKDDDKGCHIVNARRLADDVELLIENDSKHEEDSRRVSLSDAAARYVEKSSGDTWGEVLEKRRVNAEGKLAGILELMPDPVALECKAENDENVRDALAFLKLETFWREHSGESLVPLTNAAKELLARDTESWTPHGEVPPPPPPVPIPIEPEPRPFGALHAIGNAWSRAVRDGITHPRDEIRLEPYLARVIEEYWPKYVDAVGRRGLHTDVSIFVGTDGRGVKRRRALMRSWCIRLWRLLWQIIRLRRPRVKLWNTKYVWRTLAIAKHKMRVQWDFMFRARTRMGEEPVDYTACVGVQFSVPQAGGGRLSYYSKRVGIDQSVLGDLQGALDEFFSQREHHMAVIPELMFESRDDMTQWLKDTDNNEVAHALWASRQGGGIHMRNHADESAQEPTVSWLDAVIKKL